MGFCGFTLRTTANTAGLLAILNFFVFVPIDVGIIISINSSQLLQSDSLGWNHFVKGFSALHKTNVFVILLLIRLSLHILWLITVPLIFIGNATNRRSYLFPWEYVAIVKILYMLAATTYFLIGNNQCGFLERLPVWLKNYIEEPTKQTGEQAARLATLLNLGDGGPICWVVVILLVACVHMRGLQIKYCKKENSLVNSGQIQLVPYRIPRPKLTASSEDLVPGQRQAGPIPAISRQYYDNYGFQPSSGKA